MRSAASASAWSLQGRGDDSAAGAAAAAAAGGSRGEGRWRTAGSEAAPLVITPSPSGVPHGRRESVPGPESVSMSSGLASYASRPLLLTPGSNDFTSFGFGVGLGSGQGQGRTLTLTECAPVSGTGVLRPAASAEGRRGAEGGGGSSSRSPPRSPPARSRSPPRSPSRSPSISSRSPSTSPSTSASRRPAQRPPPRLPRRAAALPRRCAASRTLGTRETRRRPQPPRRAAPRRRQGASAAGRS